MDAVAAYELGHHAWRAAANRKPPGGCGWDDAPAPAGRPPSPLVRAG